VVGVVSTLVAARRVFLGMVGLVAIPVTTGTTTALSSCNAT
jgi:hypothetical protein